jgi:ABC-2 type transport system permease protein
MNGFYAALLTEAMKALKSKMFWITLLFFAFISIMMGLLMFVLKHPEFAGNSAAISTKASVIGKADWPSYFSLLIQLALVMGIMGPGIVSIWVFGREYSDRTVKDLLALPVSRFKIVLSKFIIVFLWSILLLFLLFTSGVLTGLIVRLNGWTKEGFISCLCIFTGTSLLTILLFTPVSLITSISRGYLLPVAYVILTLMITQLIFLGLAWITPYFPWAIPALFSGISGPDNPKPESISYIILGITALIGFFGTAGWWQFADHK